MRIGFDGKRAVNNMTGLGNYSRLVIESLAEAYPEDSHLIYVPKLKDNARLHKINNLHNIEFRLPPARGFKGSLWRTFGISNNLRSDKVDIYHGLSNELPLNIKSSGVRSIVTIHDVIYRRLPHCYSAIDRLLYDFKYGSSCRNANRIIAISECTKKDVMEYYEVPEDKIDVIYQGCDDSFKQHLPENKLEEERRRLNLPKRFILQVGTVEERKNLEMSVRALSAIPEDVYLVAIGKDRLGYKKKVEQIANEIGVANRVVWRHDISFADLPAVNQLAEAMSYPSRYEGFGIPILEALESETPIVAATGSCLEEAGGEGTIYVDPDNVREWGSALNSILTRQADISRMISLGKQHAAKFSNSSIAERLMGVYEKTLR